MAAEARYASRMAVAIGAQKQVELPPRVFCGRLTGFLFDTDKCFVLPGALSGMREIKRFYDDHPGLTVLISGHADRAGSAAHNLELSTERARAVAAFLQDQSDEWMPWYGASKPATKRWGTLEDQHMLAALGHYDGPVHGREDAPTREAVTRFREEAGLGAGKMDQAARRKLVDSYLHIDGTSLPAGTTVEVHGCGEAHPAVEGDDEAEAENRRVEVFLFEGPVEPAPSSPCPAGGCAQYPAWKQRVVETIDLRVRRDLAAITVSLRNRAAELITNAPYRMQAGDRSCAGRAANGQATLLVPLDADRCLVEWGRADDEDIGAEGQGCFSMELYLHYDVGTDEEQARMRLHNLGYPDDTPLEDALRWFQEDLELELTGELDEETKQKLVEVHGQLARPVGGAAP